MIHYWAHFVYRYMHISKLYPQGSSFFELHVVEISMTIVNSRVSAMLSQVTYSNLNDPASIDWPFP